MARHKKDGKRALGIQSKKGFLYIVTSNKVKKDGAYVIEKRWISTGLPDTPDNIKKASEIRSIHLNNRAESVIDRNITLGDYTDIILNRKKREIHDTTYATYSYAANKIKTYFGDTKLKNLNEVLVADFLDDLFISDHLQPRTVKDIKMFFNIVLSKALKEGILTYHPGKDVKINKNLASEYSKEKSVDDRFFSYDEAQTFLNKAESHELYELFYVTLFFGLRREEVLGLRWSCIDFNNRTLTINHTVTKGTTINRLNSTKTIASARIYPLNDEQVNMFKYMREREKANRELCGNGYFDSDYVFKHIDGTLYYPDYPSKAFRKLIKSVPELPQEVKFHGLRYSCVSILVHEGNDIKSIQKWVGHEDIDTTLRIYAKVKEKEAKKEISSVMNNLIQPKKYSNDQETN